jgi:acyl dehydratase
MAKRGVYSEAEKKMLAEYEKLADKMSGWNKEMRHKVATEDSMVNWALAMDPWNPLWRDEHYAKNTGWGGIIAAPMYQEGITLISWMLPANPDVGFMDTSPGPPLMLGEDWEFFKPIRPGDSFRVWRRRAELFDVTSPDQEDLRRFNLKVHDLDLINQRDEPVNSFKCYLSINFTNKPPAPAQPVPHYFYSQEELDYIWNVFEAETLRGADTLFWEDVNIGDELQPVANGPTTAWDMMVFTAARNDLDLLPMMEIRRSDPRMCLVDPNTNVVHHGMEMHLTDRAAHARGMQGGIHSGGVERQIMARLVSNWMGDEGFIRVFNWRYYTPSYIGETHIGHGRVVGKRIENGEHLVDLSVWLDNIRGNTAVGANVAVRLCSREDL